MAALFVLGVVFVVQSPGAQYDTEHLRVLIDAREQSMSEFAWRFSAQFVSASGARIGPKGEPEGAPMISGQLWVSGRRKRLDTIDSQRALDIQIVWDGRQLTRRTRPLPGSASDVAGAREVFTQGGRIEEYFLAAYLPDSFGIGFNGWPMSAWLRGPHEFIDLGTEPIHGVDCRKVLITRKSPGSVDKTTAPVGLLWLDEHGSLLVLRARTFAPAHVVSIPSPPDQHISIGGHDFAPMSSWEVLDHARHGNIDLPTRGRFQMNVPGALTSYEVELEPVDPPEGGWPPSTFEMRYYQGAIVRDAYTDERRVIGTDGLLGAQLDRVEDQIRYAVTAHGLTSVTTVNVAAPVWMGASCGSIATYMFLRLSGRTPDAPSLVTTLGDRSGVELTLAELQKYIESQGVPTHAYALDIERLRRLVHKNEPLLMHLVLPGEAVGHFVVGFRGDEVIHIYDPTTSTRQVAYATLDRAVSDRLSILIQRELDVGGTVASWYSLLRWPLFVASAVLVAMCVRALTRRRRRVIVNIALLSVVALTAACSDSNVRGHDGTFIALIGSPLAAEGGGHVDLGERPYGVETEHSVRIRNTGHQTLLVDRLATSCGCTSATIEPIEIAPGAEGILRLRISMDVVFKREVQVTFASSRAPGWLGAIDITARVASRPIFICDPDRCVIDAGQDSAELMIRCLYPTLDSEDLLIVEAPKWLAATVHRTESLILEQANPERRWRLTAAVQAELTPGGYDGTIIVQSSENPSMRLSIPVSVTRAGNFRASQAALFLGNSIAGITEAAFTIVKTREEAVVTDVRTSAERVHASHDRSGRITVAVDPAGVRAGELVREYVEIVSNPGQEVMRVDILGRVAQ